MSTPPTATTSPTIEERRLREAVRRGDPREQEFTACWSGIVAVIVSTYGLRSRTDCCSCD